MIRIRIKTLLAAIAAAAVAAIAALIYIMSGGGYGG